MTALCSVWTANWCGWSAPVKRLIGVAQEWLTLLQKSAALGDVKGPMDAASQQSWGAFFWQHRNGLIDPDTRARLQNGGEAQAQWILSQLYSAFSG